MTKDVHLFERAVLDLVRKSLAEAETIFQEVGLSPRLHELRQANMGTPDYYSEVSVFFYQGDLFIDVIEFFIYQDGKPTASLEEIQTWLRETIRDVIRRIKERTGQPSG